MKSRIFLVGLMVTLSQCTNSIKNENAKVIEEKGTEIVQDTSNKLEKTIQSQPIKKEDNEFIGFWVGYFEQDLNEGESEYDKSVSPDEGFYWMRENKINISIDEINGDIVKGHSVVAGNNRQFTGKMTITNSGTYFDVKEHGDNKYDGQFKFTIMAGQLSGTWKSYKKIDIEKRKYTLEKKEFLYNPNQQLFEGEFIDWTKMKTNKKMAEDWDGSYNEFASATNKIYKINASNILLTKKDVQNLKRGDLLIIRNAIYARHGYSFKNRPLRVYFDAQEWYIPVFTDIKNELTEIEKKNIELLLLYEKNAKEYYDYFGRG